MTEFGVSPLRTNSVAYLNRLRDSIRVDPVYQRQGEVWTRSKQQLLIDSIINRFDIPKLYLHEHIKPLDVDNRRVRYSIVDGRQRLEAIWDFLSDGFSLSNDFVLLDDGSTQAAGKTYAQLEKEVPEIAALLAATSIDVMLIRTDDIELIEEMFSRLNEAVPLNAAEKRNGRSGPLRAVVRDLVAHRDLFQDRLPFGNNRYRHYDLATKFLYWADRNGVADVKKRRLDDFWDDIAEDKDTGQARADRLMGQVGPILSAMADTFESNEPLLANVGMVSVYYLLYQSLIHGDGQFPSRDTLLQFDKARQLRRRSGARFADESELNESGQRLVEFNRLAQSPNDEAALKYRLEVLRDYIRDPASFEWSAE